MKYRILLIVSILFLSACHHEEQDKADPNAWKSEVLQMEECGLDGLSCCADREASCSFGMQCCTDPAGSGRNYCAEECVCGVEGRFCCATDAKCGDGLNCVDGDCVACGQKDQICCADNTCGTDLLCHDNLCRSCGENGAPCCVSAPYCKGEEVFDDKRQGCSSGICAYCGHGSMATCQNEPLCNPGHLLTNDSCLQCGHDNQPCCEKNGEKVCNDGLTCQLGFCAIVNSTN